MQYKYECKYVKKKKNKMSNFIDEDIEISFDDSDEQVSDKEISNKE